MVVGDLVAISYGRYMDLVARILSGAQDELSCEITGGAGLPVGAAVTITPDQLLLKVQE